MEGIYAEGHKAPECSRAICPPPPPGLVSSVRVLVPWSLRLPATDFRSMSHKIMGGSMGLPGVVNALGLRIELCCKQCGMELLMSGQVLVLKRSDTVGQSPVAGGQLGVRCMFGRQGWGVRRPMMHLSFGGRSCGPTRGFASGLNGRWREERAHKGRWHTQRPDIAFFIVRQAFTHLRGVVIWRADDGSGLASGLTGTGGRGGGETAPGRRDGWHGTGLQGPLPGHCGSQSRCGPSACVSGPGAQAQRAFD